jgi:hypothetical protein
MPRSRNRRWSDGSKSVGRRVAFSSNRYGNAVEVLEAELAASKKTTQQH